MLDVGLLTDLGATDFCSVAGLQEQVFEHSAFDLQHCFATALVWQQQLFAFAQLQEPTLSRAEHFPVASSEKGNRSPRMRMGISLVRTCFIASLFDIGVRVSMKKAVDFIQQPFEDFWDPSWRVVLCH